MAGIVGHAKVSEIAYWNREQNSVFINDLKQGMINKLQQHVLEIRINSGYHEDSLTTILSVNFPHLNKKSLSGYFDNIGITVLAIPFIHPGSLLRYLNHWEHYLIWKLYSSRSVSEMHLPE